MGDLEEATAGVKMKAAAEGEVAIVDSRKELFIWRALVRHCSLSLLLLCEDPAKNPTIIVGD
jgi:hypothetical protein